MQKQQELISGNHNQQKWYKEQIEKQENDKKDDDYHNWTELVFGKADRSKGMMALSDVWHYAPYQMHVWFLSWLLMYSILYVIIDATGFFSKSVPQSTGS